MVVSNEKKNTIEDLSLSLYTSIEKLLKISENIAESNTEIHTQIQETCRNVRTKGKAIIALCCNNNNGKYMQRNLCEESTILAATRSLMRFITRILLLVDILVVKQLLSIRRKSSHVISLQTVINFIEFVRAFESFGVEIIEFAVVIKKNINSERNLVHFYTARIILEQSIKVLLSSSKTALVHMDCSMAKENRDTVFCQIRRGMDIIHFVIKESISDNTDEENCGNSRISHFNKSDTIYNLMQKFLLAIEKFYVMQISEKNNLNEIDEELFNNTIYRDISTNSIDILKPRKGFSKQMCLYTVKIIEELISLLERVLERVNDFTDSAYTSHENRELVLLSAELFKEQFQKLIAKICRNDNLTEEIISSVLKCTENLYKNLILTIKHQILELRQLSNITDEIINNFHTSGINRNIQLLYKTTNKCHDYCDQISEVCKLMQHLAPTEFLQIKINYLWISLRIFGPQVLVASKVFFKYPKSNTSVENLSAFTNIWKWFITETLSLSNLILESKQLSKKEDLSKNNESFLSPNKFASSNSPKDNKDETSFSDSAKNFDDKNESDILKRAKNMSSMAFSMYQFTKGSGTLKTTQDLFTQAEYFAEEANRLYKIMRQFSYQVPAGSNKKDLLNSLDSIPTFVQALQFSVKDHTVGKAATFVKVEHVLKETKNLMVVIDSVVNKCFQCATKYNIDFNTISGDLSSSNLIRNDENNCGGMGDTKGTQNTGEGNM